MNSALLAHLYGLSRAEFAHILGAFPRVFPDDAQGKAKRAALLARYERKQRAITPPLCRPYPDRSEIPCSLNISRICTHLMPARLAAFANELSSD